MQKKYKDQKFIPGKKICRKCYKELGLLLYSDILADGDAVYEVEEVYLDERPTKSLVHLDTPIKKFKKDRVEGYGKRKLVESFADVLPGLNKLKIYTDCEELINKLKGKFLSDSGT